MKFPQLPQKIYEALRWIVTLVLPAIAVLLSTLTTAWGWAIPIDAINSTIAAVALFLGAIFGISKIAYDKSAATTASAKKAKSKSK